MIVESLEGCGTCQEKRKEIRLQRAADGDLGSFMPNEWAIQEWHAKDHPAVEIKNLTA